jgi:hypothetical protein
MFYKSFDVSYIFISEVHGQLVVVNGMWTWISGSNTTDQHGVYGEKGIPSSLNVPGARQNAVSWIDKNGNLWLFGGLGYAATGSYGTYL